MFAAIFARLPIDKSVQVPLTTAVIKLLALSFFVVIIESLETETQFEDVANKLCVNSHFNLTLYVPLQAPWSTCREHRSRSADASGTHASLHSISVSKRFPLPKHPP